MISGILYYNIEANLCRGGRRMDRNNEGEIVGLAT